MKFWVLVVLACHLTVALGGSVNRPVIGILTQPSSSSLQPFGNSYIASSYVKYAEAGGAQVVPVFYDASEEELAFTFSQINGLLFPGGGSNLYNTTLYKAGKYLYDLAIADEEDYFVIFGHCQGFELLTMVTSENLDILGSDYNSENISMALNFTGEALRSKTFRDAPSNVMQILANDDVCMNNHQMGVDFDTWYGNGLLPAFYDILSWNQDRDGRYFISTFEGKEYPIYGIQWHAEKPQFEWNPDEVINHSPEAIEAMQYMQRFFINEARKSTHSFKSQALLDSMLIYNYPLVYTEEFDSSFETCYMFE